MVKAGGIDKGCPRMGIPAYSITRTIAGEDFAIVEFTLKMDMRQDGRWIPTQRRQVVVLELKSSHIQRIIDHWSR